MEIFMEILMMDSMGWPYDSSDCLLYLDWLVWPPPNRSTQPFPMEQWSKHNVSMLIKVGAVGSS